MLGYRPALTTPWWRGPLPALFAAAALCGLCLLSGPAGGSGRDSDRGNGIAVGRAKVYDEYSLRVMLRAAEANLARLQFFNQEALVAAMQRVQGATLDATSYSLQLSPLPIPGQKATTKAGSETETTVKTTGTAPGTTTTTTAPTESVELTTDRAEFQPQLPTPPALAPTFTAPAVGGIAAHDLLGEQEALGFQVINLRLLLEGALSDRVARSVAQIGRESRPFYGDRVQAVIGFNITLDPQVRYRHHAAEVEVTLTLPTPTSAGSGTGRESGAAEPANVEAPQGGATSSSAEPTAETSDTGVSLVALFPKEKTYNVATIRKKAANLGVGAVFQVMSAGFAQSRSRETLYLVKDVDTVALQRPKPRNDPRAIRFAWQFRPTLGRCVVDPGMRQVFAVVSIPESLAKKLPNATAHVTTRWREFCTSGKIAGREAPGSDESPFGEGAVLPLLDIGTRDSQLGPKVTGSRWADQGNGNVLVTVDGRNFTPEVRVLVSNIALGQTELVVQGDSRLIFSAPAAAFFLGRIRLVGTYGPPEPLFQPAMRGGSFGEAGPVFTATLLGVTPLDGLSSEVKLEVRLDSDARDFLEQLVVNVGGTYYGLAGAPLDRRVTERTDERVTAHLRFIAPTASLLAVDRLMVEMLRGVAYLRQDVSLDGIAPFTYDFSVGRVEEQATGEGGKRLLISGRNFMPGIKAIIKGETIGQGDYLAIESRTRLNLVLSAKQLMDLKEIILQQGPDKQPALQRTVRLSMETPKPEPGFEIGDRVFQHEVVTVRVRGTLLPQIDRIEFEGKNLDVGRAEGTGAVTAVKLTSEVTKQVGRRELDLILKNGKRLPGLLTVERPAR